MAERTFWNGYLKLSLVTCAVSLMPATSAAERIRFHTLNRKTGNRVHARYVDAVSGKPVDNDDQVKGYPKGDDDYVMLEDEEIDAVALETTHTIDIEAFVPHDAIGSVWYDTPHFLMPADEVGEEAFAVIREAMREKDVVGISRLVLYRRERAVMLEPREKGIVLWTLRYGDEVRDEPDRTAENEPDADLRTLVGELIKSRTKAWSPAMLRDPVQERLREIIAAKSTGKIKGPPKPTQNDAEDGGNVINLMDALKKSLKARR